MRRAKGKQNEVYFHLRVKNLIAVQVQDQYYKIHFQNIVVFLHLQ